MNRYARRCLLASGHPLCPLLAILTAVLFTMATFHPFVSCCSLLCAVLLYGLLSSARQAAKRAAFSLFAAVLFGVLNAFLSHRGATVLVTLWGMPFTLEAALAGVCAALSFCAAVCWFSSFHLLMHSDRIIALSGGLFPTFTLLFCMVLRFVPLFSRRAEQIAQAQDAAFGQGRRTKPARFAGVFSILITWALENGIDTADSMHARGYGTARRTNSGAVRLHRRDAVFLAAFSLCAAGAFAVLFTGKLSVWFYPVFFVFPADKTTLTGFLCSFFLFAAAPLSTAWEVIRWRFLR